jgi:hypothetical protein
MYLYSNCKGMLLTTVRFAQLHFSKQELPEAIQICKKITDAYTSGGGEAKFINIYAAAEALYINSCE